MQRGFIAYALLALAAARPAPADHHFMSVVEVFTGSAAAPTAQFVVLQAYSAGQNNVSEHEVRYLDDAGALIDDVVFGNDVGGTASQMRILIANATAAAYFQITPDFDMANEIVAAGGKLCFEPQTPVDCVAWGSYSPVDLSVGDPFAPGTGIASGLAMSRRLDISGGSTTLNAGDDTDDCANDFIAASAAPRNNAGTLGVIDPDWVFAHDFENGSTAGWGP